MFYTSSSMHKYALGFLTSMLVLLHYISSLHCVADLLCLSITVGWNIWVLLGENKSMIQGGISPVLFVFSCPFPFVMQVQKDHGMWGHVPLPLSQTTIACSTRTPFFACLEVILVAASYLLTSPWVLSLWMAVLICCQWNPEDCCLWDS